MRKCICIVFAMLAACQGTTNLVRVPMGGPGDAEPQIMQLIDLGSLSIPEEGELTTADSDGIFIAGEWVAAAGTGLNTDGTRLLLDGIETPVIGGLRGGGLIFRLPRDVKFRHTYIVRVETPLGAAERRLQVSNLIVLADARANRLVFWKSTTEKKPLFEEQEFSVPCPEAGPYAVASSGGILYATARPNQLKTIDLGAKGGPREVFSAGYEAKYPAVSLVPTAAHLFLLTTGEVVVFSLADPVRPTAISRQYLPLPGKHAAFRDLILLDGARKAVALEQENNQVYLLDFADPAKPGVSGPFSVVPEAQSSYSIGLAHDKDNADSFWFLTGLNTQQLRERFQALWNDTPTDQTPTRTALYHIDVSADGVATAPDKSILLPEGVLPLGVSTDRNGDLLITAIAYEKETLAKSSFSLRGVKNLVKGVWNSIFAARVYRVTPEGSVTNELKSVSLFVSLSSIENSPLVYSSYRLGARYLMPSVKVVLTVEVLKNQRLTVREMEMDWKYLLPPYRFFPEVTLL